MQPVKIARDHSGLVGLQVPDKMPLGAWIIDQCLLGLCILYKVFPETELPGRHGLLYGFRCHVLGNSDQADVAGIAP